MAGRLHPSEMPEKVREALLAEIFRRQLEMTYCAPGLLRVIDVRVISTVVDEAEVAAVGQGTASLVHSHRRGWGSGGMR